METLDSVKDIILEILFPKFCFGCKKEGTYLCEDCFYLAEVMENYYCLCEKPFRLPSPGKCGRCRERKLSGLYFALSYQNTIVKNLIQKFKYDPFGKGLSQTLSSLIITYFSLINKNSEKTARDNFKDFMLIPVPSHKKRLKWRGFNPAQEITKGLSDFFGISEISNCLIKTKNTPPQAELSKEKRMENIKDVFSVREPDRIKSKKILLIDDVYTTGSTMEECAGILRSAGAKEVWGIVAARD